MRIGNLIQSNADVITITEIGKLYLIGTFVRDGEIQNVRLPIKYAQPIPLTEEWLVKFGFDFTNGYGWGFVFGYINSRMIWQYNSIVVEVKYVHQLQNLFHALTEEELKIEEL